MHTVVVFPVLSGFLSSYNMHQHEVETLFGKESEKIKVNIFQKLIIQETSVINGMYTIGVFLDHVSWVF